MMVHCMTDNKNLPQKSNSNTVAFNFQMYIYFYQRIFYQIQTAFRKLKIIEEGCYKSNSNTWVECSNNYIKNI